MLDPNDKLDLKDTPFILKQDTLAVASDALKRVLPERVKIKVTGGKPGTINIRDGMWRGAFLKVRNNDGRMHLVDVVYTVPGILSNLLIFILAMAVSSVLMTVLITIIVGEFVGPVFAFGGIVGFGILSLVKAFVFIPQIKSSWSPELNRAIETLRA